MRECHTRDQRNEFKRKVQYVVTIQRSVLEMIYPELSLDSYVGNHSNLVQRIRAMFLGAPNTVVDLRHLSPSHRGGGFCCIPSAYGKGYRVGDCC